jgi:DNA-binding IclR family transcriptional regulator
MAGNSNSHGQSVASKLTRILELFTPEQPRLRATDACRRTGLPFSTVHRLLSELAGSGMLRRNGDGTYAVGIRLWELAASHPQIRSLRTAALPAMYALHTAVDADVFLDVLDGGDALCVAEVCGPGGGDRYGRRFIPRTTAGGQVLLAYAEMRSLATDGALPPDGRLRQILRIRRAGVAVAQTTRTLAVAAPVFGTSGSVVASLEAVGALPADRDGLVRAVRRAAAEAAAYPSSGNGRRIPVQWRHSGPASAS